MCDDEIKSFLGTAKIILKNFEDRLGWKGATEERCLQCPISDDHKVEEKSFKSHIRKCKWRKLGYNHEEINEIISDEDSQLDGPCIHVDDIVSEVAPGIPPLRIHEHYVSMLTTGERLQIYDRVIEKLHGRRQQVTNPKFYKELQTNYGKMGLEQSKSDTEVLKEMRDHKRRRQTYRAKNVHVTKRSQTEIIRQLLAVHMENLHHVWNQESVGCKSPRGSQDSKTPPEKQSPIQNSCASRQIHDMPYDRNALKSRSRDFSHDHNYSDDEKSHKPSRDDSRKKLQKHEKDCSKSEFGDNSQGKKYHKRSRRDHRDEDHRRRKSPKHHKHLKSRHKKHKY